MEDFVVLVSCTMMPNLTSADIALNEIRQVETIHNQDLNTPLVTKIISLLLGPLNMKPMLLLIQKASCDSLELQRPYALGESPLRLPDSLHMARS